MCSAERREEYQDMAMDIFVKQAPKDSRTNKTECTSCDERIPDW